MFVVVTTAEPTKNKGNLSPLLFSDNSSCMVGAMEKHDQAIAFEDLRSVLGSAVNAIGDHGCHLQRGDKFLSSLGHLT